MISILPRSIVADEIGRGGIKRLPITIVNTLEPYGIIRRRGEQLSNNAEELTGILRGLMI
jgi:DNA-binding transcriptional LysR family regulator